MRFGKKLVHLAMVLLCIATLGIAVATAFGMTQLFWIGWGMFAASLVIWFIFFAGVEAKSPNMTIDEETAAQASQVRYIGTGAIALILALIFMLCCTTIRGVWKYTEKNDIAIHSITTDELNVTEVNATEVNATEANITKVNATEANVTKVNATEANITKVNATEVNATKVNATELHVTKAYIDKAEIDKAEINDAYINNAYIDKGYIGQLLGGLLSGNTGNSGGADKGKVEEPTTVKREEPTTKPPVTNPPTTKPTEPTTVLNPSLKFEADKMSGGAPLMNSASDKVYIIIEDCSINDINYYWCNPDTGINTKDGISFVKVSDGKYKMVVEDWVFENSLDVAIKNPATKNQYYVVKIQPTYE